MPSATSSKPLDQHPNGRQFTKVERERLVQTNLRATTPRNTAPSVSKSESQFKSYPTSAKSDFGLRRPRGFRQLLRNFIHKFLYILIQIVFSIYIRTRQTYHALTDRILSILYYHHRTPELIQRDVKDLTRLPNHLSVIVELSSDGSKTGEAEGLAQLMSDVAEISAWCTCAGIPMVSIYERTGILKSHMPSLHNAVSRTFHSYFPPAALPNLHIRAPNQPAYSPPDSRSPSTSPPRTPPEGDEPVPENQRPTLNVLLLSSADGRATLVDLTKTLAEMSQRGKLTPADISPELIDAEVSESSCGEPDLLIIMAPSVYRGRGAAKKVRRRSRSRNNSVRVRRDSDGPAAGGVVVNGDARSEGDQVSRLGPAGDMCLRGYPPWQVRLTEIFNVQDNSGVDYQVFLRGLYRYAKAEMRFGR